MIENDERAALSEVAKQRSQTYWWLSERFLEPPDPAGIASLVERTGENAGSGTSVPLESEVRELAEALKSADASEIAVEHARLFAGMGASYCAVPPYESMQADSEFRVENVTNVTAAYRDAGFEQIDIPGVPQDHIAVELRFMALLAANECEAWTTSGVDEARVVLLREQSFLSTHLLRWVPAYCERAVREARVPYLKALVRLLAAAIEVDRDNVDDLLRATSGA